MKIKVIKIDETIEQEDNPNKMEPRDYATLLEQVQREQVLLQPPLVRELDEGYQIIDGHHRIRAAADAGLAKVHAVVLGADEHLDDRILQVSMNKLRGRLDLVKVGELAESLSADGVLLDDVLLMGYTEPELNDLIGALAEDVDPGLEDVRDLSIELEKEPKPFVLEIAFTDREMYKACRKALRRAASGADLSDGLAHVLGLD